MSGTVDRAKTLWTPVAISVDGKLDGVPEVAITERADVAERVTARPAGQ